MRLRYSSGARLSSHPSSDKTSRVAEKRANQRSAAYCVSVRAPRLWRSNCDQQRCRATSDQNQSRRYSPLAGGCSEAASHPCVRDQGRDLSADQLVPRSNETSAAVDRRETPHAIAPQRRHKEEKEAEVATKRHKTHKKASL